MDLGGAEHKRRHDKWMSILVNLFEGGAETLGVAAIIRSGGEEGDRGTGAEWS